MNKNRFKNNTKSNMKKIFVILSVFLLTLGFSVMPVKRETISKACEKKGKLAIVIDDFGEDRHGVEEMLALPTKLTVAVIPECEYSKEDAEKAHKNGHEVILHMPMENQTQAPASYYGPVLIKNSFSEDEAVKTLSECIEKTPHCKGVNIHMGTGVSKNKKLISAMMNEVKRRDMFFLDSKTVEDTVCPECAKNVGVKFLIRDVFLEPSGRPNYDIAESGIMQAAELALKNGKAIAIGHVGPVGEEKTAKAIGNCLQKLEEMGVEIVHLSELL